MLAEKMKNRKKLILYVLAFNAFFLLICLLFFHPHFETNDDYALVSIVAGAMGKPSEYTVFIHVLIGKLLAGLFSIAPAFNWYTFFMYLVTFVSVNAVTLVLAEKKRGISYILCFAFATFFAYDCYVNVQFTKVAGIATLAGLVVLWFTYTSKKHWGFYIAGGLWIVLGSMIRFSAFSMVACVAASFLILDLIRGYISSKDKKKFAVKVGTIVGILALVCGSVFAVREYNSWYYNKQDDWAYYKVYSKARVSLTDYPYPSYEGNKAMYDELGLNENDVFLYSHWTFYDPDIYTVDMMKQISTAQERAGISGVADDITWHVIPGYLSYSVLKPLLVVMLAVVLFAKKKRWFAAVALFDLIVSNCYFSYIQRSLQYRVDVVLLMTIFVFLALVFNQIEDWNPAFEKKSILAFAAAIMLIVNSSSFSTDLYNKKAKLSKEKKEEYIEAYNSVYEDSEHLYFAVTPCSMRFAIYDMFDSIPQGQYSNILSLGGWTVMMPDELAIMDKFGITNPFRDTVNHKDIYFISNETYMKRILTYVRDHYYPDAKLKACRKLGDLYVYKIVR